MEFYIPSIFIIFLAAAFVFAVIPKMTPVILAVFATLFLFLAIYNHYSLFLNEYNNMNWANSATAAAPYLVIMSVIVLSIGYIILLFSTGKAPNLNRPPPTPAPDTATNVFTRAVGNSLAATGLLDESPPENTAGRNALNSGLSKKV